MWPTSRLKKALADSFRTKPSRRVLPEVSPVLKTPLEVEQGSPLFLDMVDDAILLVDRDGFLSQVLQNLRDRLARLGARRIWRGNAWFWDLKPDYKPGEVFEL